MKRTPGALPSDESAREIIRNSLDESLLVEASAGTGKTSELVRRIVNVLKSGKARVEGIAAVTFTNKAAGELKLRVRQELDRERSRAEGAEAAALEDALERLEEAAIGTIHSFCGMILRERPVEAVVDPAFEEMDEAESDRLYQRAFRSWMQDRLNQPSPALRRALTRLAWPGSWDDSTPIDQLRWAGRNLLEWRDHPAPWARLGFDRTEEIDELAAFLLDTAPRIRRSVAYRPIHELAEWISRAEAVAPRDYDTLEARLSKLHDDIKRASGLEALLPRLKKFSVYSGADLASALRDEMWELVERFEEQKRRSGKLDFLDLLLRTRDLVRDNRDVRVYLQRRFTHLFVDEFQDTDPVQAEILVLIAAGNADENRWLKVTSAPGKLFVVGDPKQSIYKFRRADVALYQKVRQNLVDQGVRRIQLTRSFRSVRPIQLCINAAFESEMQGNPETGQIEYAPLEEHAPAIDGQPAVVVLPVPAPYGQYEVTKKAVTESLPGAITGFVEWLLHESGWQVRSLERGGELEPVSARHICILFRRRTQGAVDLTREYIRSLEARGIPHLLAGSRSYHAREEVETIRVALAAIEWPFDELSVYATLRGSLFAIEDSILFAWRETYGALNPFRVPAEVDATFAPIAEALQGLAEFHRRRNWRPIAGTVTQLLESARAHAAFAVRPGGQQALANLYRLVDIARGYESSGGISFRGFVDLLEDKAERGDTAEAPVLEEGADGVRLMTVHTAKGLEFPVVILADPSANLAATDPDRHVDATVGLCASRLLRCSPYELLANQDTERARELAEGVRVAYVAATRARDLLVIPAVGDEPFDGWLSPLNKAIYPSRDRWRKPERAEGCPKFGISSVLSRTPDHRPDEDFSVSPGLHRFPATSHEVVWWDPQTLRLQAESDFGLQQEEILGDDGGRSLTRYQGWLARRTEVLARGRTPSLTIFTPTSATAVPDGTGLIEIHSLPRAEGRPGGRRFGALVHAAIAEVDLEDPRLEDLLSRHGRRLASTPEELEAARVAVQSVVAHPLVQNALRADRTQREWPIRWREGPQVLEGTIDFAYLAHGEWTILDFKTDAGELDTYRAQVGWYVLALNRLTGLPVRGYLLSV